MDLENYNIMWMPFVLTSLFTLPMIISAPNLILIVVYLVISVKDAPYQEFSRLDKPCDLGVSSY